MIVGKLSANFENEKQTFFRLKLNCNFVFLFNIFIFAFIDVLQVKAFVYLF